MSKQQALRVLNPVLGVLLLVQVAGPMLGQVVELPPIQYQLHTWNGILIGVLVVVHLVLNWPWIRSNYLKRKAAR